MGCKEHKSEVNKKVWGEVEGKEVYLYSLTNSKGMEVKLTNYGGIITSIFTSDKNGKFDDVVLGFDNLQQYITSPNGSMGATIGRFANRIKNGRFVIDGISYQLPLNNGAHTLHGGFEFEKTVWDSEIIKTKLGNGIQLHYLSKDGQMGFPGNLDVYVTYTLTEENAIHVSFEATTDKATHVNFTQHSYFNLAGGKELIYDHLVKIEADNYLEFDEDVNATGRTLPLKGKSWDLSCKTRLGDQIHNIHLNGYHHCYVLNKPKDSLRIVAEALEPKYGRTLKVSTTQPGIVFYASNVLSDTVVGKYRIKYRPHAAFCIETQDYPDAPNQPNFPSTLLNPGEKYEEVVIYDFGTVSK
ncbi:hypothetical protein A8C32_07515 [Flavivirga aquatica]|uniref:Aldose 1-epimerase n=1 Tax=Flavivirga aquatica TaxID=1849968 RepID=A0A1E5SIQ6_9FLAO|nr:aldose epimerase family protein [Flavivirga aquatica]OEJ99017.1 hypothetical protein A8C32_07515 [Flavivirga aquatica]